MSQLNIYSALYNDFAHLDEFGTAITVSTPDELNAPGILILHGGEDISPSIYNSKVGAFTGASDKPSRRDQRELALAQSAIEKGIPIFGICRGAQLSCALAGGKLVQHTTGHLGDDHKITTNFGKELMSNTCHHQMMNPFKTNFELLAWTTNKQSDFHLDEENKDIKLELEPEVIWFKDIKALAIQGHPEWKQRSHEFVNYCLQLVKDKMLK